MAPRGERAHIVNDPQADELATLLERTLALEESLRGECPASAIEEAKRGADLARARDYASRLQELARQHGVRSPRPAALARAESLIAWEPSSGAIEDHLERVRRFIASSEAAAAMRGGLAVAFSGVSLAATVDASSPAIKTVANSNPVGGVVAAVLAGRRARKGGRPLQKTFYVLKDLKGTLAPSTSTLVLGPPGSSKTSFLKLVAGRLRPSGDVRLAGTVTYNGIDVYGAARRPAAATNVERCGPGNRSSPSRSVGKARPFMPAKVATFVSQIDQHAPCLTVRETLRFAFETQAPDAARPRGGVRMPFQKLLANKVDAIMKVFGIDHVADTIVGDALRRGVSGGQRRRVTVAEMVMGAHRLICGDEITTGLDSQTAYELVHAIAAASKVFRKTSVLSLLQPPPEVFDCFDALVLLDSGRVIYHGPPEAATAYFGALGFVVPRRKDAADFLVEASSARAALDALAGEPADLAPDDWSRGERLAFERPLAYYAGLCARRKYREVRGDPAMYVSKVVSTTIVGFATGTVFRGVAYDDFATKYGLAFSAVVTIGLGGMSSIAGLIDRRATFYKQRDAFFFPTLAYTLAEICVDLPIVLVEALVYANAVYWFVGFTASAFPAFFLVVFLVSLSMRQLFATFAAVMPSAAAAQPAAGLTVVLCVLFSGFVIARDNIPVYWLFFYWFSPVAWGLRAVLVNEFRSSTYDKSTPDVLVKLGCDPEDTDGVCFLSQFDFQHNRAWVTLGVGVLAGYFLVFAVASTVALDTIRHGSAGAPSSGDDDDVDFAGDDDASNAGAAEPPPLLCTLPSPRRGSAAHKAAETRARNSSTVVPETVDAVASSLPFEPATLSFHDVHYFVPVPKSSDRAAPDRLELLDGVSAFCKPGDMTALMGSSGAGLCAGKTTLLDVLAGRKTGGWITGNISLNGRPKDQKLWVRVSGYVEQLDVHSPGATVAEAVDFSAQLRLPQSTAPKQRWKLIQGGSAYVRDILDLLELGPVARRLVGSIAEGGLSFEQRKRLTMAVEMAANPAVLFLDEPTSGLDSRAALVVIRAVANVAKTNRSVICTIHQPSAALFLAFDRLLLLKKGGKMVYFGELGEDCATLVSYLSDAATSLGAGLPPLAEGQNPATWMLTAAANEAEVLAALEGSAPTRNPLLGGGLEAPLLDGDAPPPDAEPGPSMATEFLILSKKMAITYWRSPAYNVARLMVSVIVSVFFGSCYTAKITDVNGALGRSGLLFVSTYFMGVIYMVTGMPLVAAERAAFYREQSSSMYRPLPYAMAYVLVEIPYLVVYSFIFCGVLFGIVDMYGGYEKFLWYVAIYMGYVSFMCFFGQFLVVALPDEASAQAIGPSVSSLFSLFSGFVIAPAKMPSFWMFMYWISPCHYFFEGLVVTQFHGVSEEVVVGAIPTPAGPVPVEVSLSTLLTGKGPFSKFNGEFLWEHRWTDLIFLFAMVAALRILSTFFLAFVKYKTV
ncbi:ATPase [Aureococcus anophagefferens]|nr:ATPase [Aureococcus anophagefferens]